jgi:adenylate cyclase class 2
MEVEIKLRVADREAMVRKLRRLNARGGARMYEMNTLFDTPSGAIAREDKLIRIRVEWPAPSSRAGKTTDRRPLSVVSRSLQSALLTYKGPAQKEGSHGSPGQRYKIREEHDVRVEDAAALAQVFKGMGLRPCFRYEKYRSTYRLAGFQGLKVELDETPIGDFLELEGGREEIDRCAALLGFCPADYITESYGALFLERRRSQSNGAGTSAKPSLESGSVDMLFA